MRYRFYREHKYVSFRFSELERLIAKIDFAEDLQVGKIKEELMALESLMKGHAHYEDATLHKLLRQKGSTTHQEIENEHQQHEMIYQDLLMKIEEIISNNDKNKKIQLGYEFYLHYRLFVAENLKHLHQEETIIMPELQKLYSDDELRKIEFNTYDHMTPDQMKHMLDELFPHMNPSDHAVFLKDIQDAEPEKFLKIQSQ